MISLSRKNLIIAGLIWGIGLIVCIPVYMFVLKPQEGQMAGLAQDVNNLQIEVNRIKIAASKTARENLKKENDDLKVRLGDFVIDSNAIQSLATEIINISKNIGLEEFHIDPWSGVTVAAFSDCKYVLGQTIIVSFNAGFPEFAKFINMLERHKVTVFIDSFSVTRGSDEKAKHKVSINLAVLVAKQTPVKGARG